MLAIDWYVGWKFDLAVAAVLVPVFVLYVRPWLDRHMSKYADGEVFLGELPETDKREYRFDVPQLPVTVGKPGHRDFEVLDQGPYGSSVGYGSHHALLVGSPVMVGTPWYESFYDEARQIEQPVPDDDEGSYVRGALHDWKTNGWL